MFAELKAAPEAEGARAVVNRDPSRVGYFEVNDPAICLDLDEPADLERAGLGLPPLFRASKASRNPGLA
jgi:CTP:molybdopterin cytidylyltransferase MocA